MRSFLWSVVLLAVGTIVGVFLGAGSTQPVSAQVEADPKADQQKRVEKLLLELEEARALLRQKGNAPRAVPPEQPIPSERGVPVEREEPRLPTAQTRGLPPGPLPVPRFQISATERGCYTVDTVTGELWLTVPSGNAGATTKLRDKLLDARPTTPEAPLPATPKKI